MGSFYYFWDVIYFKIIFSNFLKYKLWIIILQIIKHKRDFLNWDLDYTFDLEMLNIFSHIITIFYFHFTFIAYYKSNI